MKTVITGGAGFIGSHLTARLLERGDEVTVLDDLSSGSLEKLRRFGGGDAGVVRGNILDEQLLTETLRGAGCVFHLAAQPSVPRSIEDPLGTHQLNATGTLNVLEAARLNHVPKVVYASTCAVYGNTEVLPIAENAPLSPLSPYAAAKLAGEYYASVYARTFGVSVSCLRFFNVYGPGQEAGSAYAGVIPSFISRVLRGEAPVIQGDGEQTRDLIYVKDVVEACLFAASLEESDVYNVGTGQPVSVNEIAAKLITLKAPGLTPVREAPRAGDIKHSYADISKLGRKGFRPARTIDEGLAATVNDWS